MPGVDFQGAHWLGRGFRDADLRTTCVSVPGGPEGLLRTAHVPS